MINYLVPVARGGGIKPVESHLTPLTKNSELKTKNQGYKVPRPRIARLTIDDSRSYNLAEWGMFVLRREL